MIAAPHVDPGFDSSLEWGTVGWSDGQHYELGDGSGSDSGIALVHVTLFRGRDPSQPLDNTKAQGKEILCQMAAGFFQIPPLGCNVLVATPHAYGDLPGSSTILQARDERGSTFYGGMAPGELCLGGLVGMGRLITKKNGAIVLYTTSDNTTDGTGVSAYIGPDKIQFANQYGAITIDTSGITLTAGQAALMLDAAGDAKLQGQTASVVGSAASIAGTVSTAVGTNPGSVTLIGPLATLVPPTTALYGPSGTLAVPSTTVYISP